MQVVHLKNLGKPNLIISDCGNVAGKNVLNNPLLKTVK